MAAKTIDIPVKLDAAAFQQFALFDTFRLRKRWLNPALFAGIMLVFACVCFFSGGALLGGVLLAVGLFLPLSYIGFFLSDVKKKSRMMGLDTPRNVYMVQLSSEGVVHRTVSHPPQTTETAWAEMFGAWRTQNAVYLYKSQNAAYLLPEGQASVSDDALWNFLLEKLGHEKCRDLRK